MQSQVLQTLGWAVVILLVGAGGIALISWTLKALKKRPEFWIVVIGALVVLGLFDLGEIGYSAEAVLVVILAIGLAQGCWSLATRLIRTLGSKKNRVGKQP